jgi:hypothetical protein
MIAPLGLSAGGASLEVSSGGRGVLLRGEPFRIASFEWWMRSSRGEALGLVRPMLVFGTGLARR